MSPEMFQLIASSTLDTLVMVGLSGLLGTLFGLPLGIFLATSRAGELFAAPFIILVVAIVPLTRLLVGTSIGTRAAVVPLTIAAIPFIARVVEAAIREVDQGLVEAARAFGASPFQIVRKVLLPEALPALTLALTLTLVSLLGYSAMVGAVGGGGLGDLGIRYGYQRFMPEVMAAVVIVLIVLVQGVQTLGEMIARRLDKRSRQS